MRLPVLCALAVTALISGCSSTKEAPRSSEMKPLAVMERVAIAANRCWFKSGDASFAAYRLAPELNSFSGTPRILVVKKHSPEALPLLVVQASGSPAELSTFGPLLKDGNLAARVNHDVQRWALGSSGC